MQIKYYIQKFLQRHKETVRTINKFNNVSGTNSVYKNQLNLYTLTMKYLKKK